jgi:lysozyme family protein
MAEIVLLVPKILQWEGGYVNDPSDSGGPTKMGVTIGTWRKIGYDKDMDGDIDANDVKLIDNKDFEIVLGKYWNEWRADKIKNQSIAELLVDFVWASGTWGIKIPQRVLGVDDDGVVGKQTLSAVNSYPDQKELHSKLINARLNFVDLICVRSPKNNKFKKGWKKRILSYKFKE